MADQRGSTAQVHGEVTGNIQAGFGHEAGCFCKNHVNDMESKRQMVISRTCSWRI